MSNSSQVIVSTYNNSKADAVTNTLRLQNWFRNLVKRRNAIRLVALLTLLKWEEKRRVEWELYLRVYAPGNVTVSDIPRDTCEMTNHTSTLANKLNMLENIHVYELWEVMYKVLRAVIEYERKLHAENYTRVLLSEELLESQIYTVYKEQICQNALEEKCKSEPLANGKLEELRNVIAKLLQVRKLYMLPDEMICSLLSLLQVESVMHPLAKNEEHNNESENRQEQVLEQILLLLEECIGTENTTWLLSHYIACENKRESTNALSETQEEMHNSLHNALQILSMCRRNNLFINFNNFSCKNDEEEEKKNKQEMECNTIRSNQETFIAKEKTNTSVIVNNSNDAQIVNTKGQGSYDTEEKGKEQCWPAPLSRYSELSNHKEKCITTGNDKHAEDEEEQPQEGENDQDKELKEEALWEEWENVDEEECDEERLNKRFMEHLHTREEKLRKDIADRLHIESEEAKETRRRQNENDDHFTIGSEIDLIRQFGLGMSMKTNTKKEESKISNYNDDDDDDDEKAYCAVCELTGVKANTNNNNLMTNFSTLRKAEQSAQEYLEQECELLVACATCNVNVHKMCAINDAVLGGSQYFCCTQCCKLYKNNI